MMNIRTIKRYNAYYHGWCLAFGEHTANFDEERDVNCLLGEDRIGLILSPGLRKQAQREFLGHHEEIPRARPIGCHGEDESVYVSFE